MKPKSWIAVALVSLLLAGCSNASDREGATTTTGETQNSSNSTPSSQEIPFDSRAITLGYADLYVLTEARPGDPVVITYYSKPGCKVFEDDSWTLYVTGTVWNRTGIAGEKAKMAPSTERGTLELTLPADPPYIISAGSTCVRTGELYFRGSWYVFPRPNDTTARFDDATRLLWQSVTVEVPAGSLVGTNTIDLGTELIYAENHPFETNISSDPGAPWGRLRLYAAFQSPGTNDAMEEWGFHAWGNSGKKPMGEQIGWTDDLTLRLDLDTPALNPVRWNATFHFLVWEKGPPSVFGFSFPFKDYTGNGNWPRP